MLRFAVHLRREKLKATVRSGVVWTDERELDVLENETLESIDSSEQ